MTINITAVSTEFVTVEITYRVGDVPANPTAGFTPYLAFVPQTSTRVRSAPPSSFANATWKAATWDTVDGRYFAKALVGPKNGATALAAGTYSVWVGLDGTNEEPVLFVDELVVS